MGPGGGRVRWVGWMPVKSVRLRLLIVSDDLDKVKKRKKKKSDGVEITFLNPNPPPLET